MEVLIEQRVSEILAPLLETDGDTALNPAPGRIICLAPGGLTAWDSCCDGQLSIRLVSATPKLDQRSPGAITAPCSILFWNIVVEIEILRCAAVVDNNGNAPKAEILSQEGFQAVRDLDSIVKSLQNLDFVSNIGPWTPRGPDGGCVGGTITVTFRI